MANKLPREARLWIAAEGFVEHLVELRDLEGDEVELILRRPCEFQVRLPAGAQNLELRDAEGRLVPIHADARRHMQSPCDELALDGAGWTAIASEKVGNVLLTTL